MKYIKKIIAKIFWALGYHVTFLDNKVWATYREGYELISPISTYAPWQIDEEYKKVAPIISKFTLVDNYRCYEIWRSWWNKLKN